jgi:hypothetical protein
MEAYIVFGTDVPHFVAVLQIHHLVLECEQVATFVHLLVQFVVVVVGG